MIPAILAICPTVLVEFVQGKNNVRHHQSCFTIYYAAVSDMKDKHLTLGQNNMKTILNLNSFQVKTSQILLQLEFVSVKFRLLRLGTLPAVSSVLQIQMTLCMSSHQISRLMPLLMVSWRVLLSQHWPRT
jgi:hypothetical protein